jgi:uncharacterized membrane protein
VALVTARIRQAATATAPSHSFADEEVPMTDAANHPVTKFRLVLATVFAWIEAMDYSSFDYTLDRIGRLEREVGKLKEELRQSRDTGPVDAHNGSAAGLEH